MTTPAEPPATEGDQPEDRSWDARSHGSRWHGAEPSHGGTDDAQAQDAGPDGGEPCDAAEVNCVESDYGAGSGTGAAPGGQRASRVDDDGARESLCGKGFREPGGDANSPAGEKVAGAHDGTAPDKAPAEDSDAEETRDEELWAGVSVVEPAELAGVSGLSGPALAVAVPQMAGLMADPRQLTPAQLVEMVTGAERLSRWCQAVQLAAIGQLAAYTSPELDEDGPIRSRLAAAGATERSVERGFATPRQVQEFLSDGLSCALAVSVAEADKLVGAASCLDDCQTVRELLCRGSIDRTKVKILTEELTPVRGQVDLPAFAARLAIDHGDLTRRKFRNKVRAAVAERIGVTEEHQVQRARRRVWFRPEPAGMATVGMYLPAEDAQLAFETITAAAMRNHADAEAALGPCHTRAAGEPGYCSRHGGAVSLDNLRADAFTGWVFEQHNRLIDPATGVFDDSTGDAERWANRPKRHDVSRVMLHLHLNGSTVAGVDDLPGHLMGYGPIDAEHARRLCENATVIRLLTDPVTKQVTALDTPAYKVPKILKWSVASRDGYCVFPTCENLAHTGQFDHRTPHPGGRAEHPGGRAAAKLEALGETSYDNLQSLCVHHHRLKTHGGWTVYDTGDGRIEWESPTGHHYIRDAAFTPSPVQEKADLRALQKRLHREVPPPTMAPIIEHRLLTRRPHRPARTLDGDDPPPF